MTEPQPEQEAVQVRPWRPKDGPEPRVHVYPYGRRPMLRIRTEGTWRTAMVEARYDYPTGRTAYQVDIQLVRDGIRGGYHRTYWWNPATMKPVRPGTH